MKRYHPFVSSSVFNVVPSLLCSTPSGLSLHLPCSVMYASARHREQEDAPLGDVYRVPVSVEHLRQVVEPRLLAK